MKAIYGVNGGYNTFMMNLMHIFHKKRNMHDSVDYKKMDFVPNGKDNYAEDNIQLSIWK